MESNKMQLNYRIGQGAFLLLLAALISSSGCLRGGLWGGAACAPCGGCETANSCGTSGPGLCNRAQGCRILNGCGVRGCCSGQLCDKCCFALTGWCWKRSNAIPETLPLGSIVRAHDQVMQTNAEASDFTFHRHDFVAQTAHLTPDAKDKIVEIAARMPSAPFPVIIERSTNNSNPELDALRRSIIAQILTDFGNSDAQQRTIVGHAYGPGYIGRRAEDMYYQHTGLGNNNNNNNNNGNNGGGFGGGGGF